MMAGLDNAVAVGRYFLWRFFILCSTLNFLTDSYTWPLLVYMLLICIYPFTSSCAHTFSTMSPESRHICYFFDYGALSLYSLGKASRTFTTPKLLRSGALAGLFYVPGLRSVWSLAGGNCYDMMAFLLRAMNIQHVFPG